MPNKVRLMAANYLHRAKDIVIDSNVTSLCQLIQQEKDVNIKIPLVTAIAKSKLNFALDTLISVLNSDEDYRVKCNIIRAFSLYPYAKVAAQVYQALKNENIHIQKVAANYFYHNGTAEDGLNYKTFAREAQSWQTKHILYAAANKNTPYYFTNAKQNISNELLSLYKKTDNIQEQKAIINALSEFQWNYKLIKNLGDESKNVAIKSEVTAGLVKILTSTNFPKVFNNSQFRVRNEIQEFLIEALRSKEIGSIAYAAEALQNPKALFKQYFEKNSYSFLDTVLMNLSLPKDIETYNQLEKGLYYIRGIDKEVSTKPEYNHEINWNLVTRLNQRVRGIIQTNKGKIVLEFYHKAAPASVANFIELANKEYYNDKQIHRVVPNFVVQGGCNRGDGYGSLDYTIRSEFHPNYHYDDEGYLGMASAGIDTEGVQWFITHSPTPHLDGSYTIFGKVKDGMDVVHQLEVGDFIEKIVIRF